MKIHKEIKQSRKGFSLLELLIVIALMSVVMTIGAQSFVLLTGKWQETKKMSELETHADVAFNNLEQDIADTLSAELSHVSILGINQEAKGRGWNTEADADDRLIIPVQGARDNSILKKARSIQYQVIRENDQGFLTASTGALGDKNPSGARRRIIPNADVVRFDVSYATGDPSNPWKDEWSEDELPRAVRVSMTLADPYNPTLQISRKEVYAVHVR
jgi:prepilin-type N-terminal cleavage/methylation domain-containing protein